jgi:hypothetical protein
MRKLNSVFPHEKSWVEKSFSNWIQFYFMPLAAVAFIC